MNSRFSIPLLMNALGYLGVGLTIVGLVMIGNFLINTIQASYASEEILLLLKQNKNQVAVQQLERVELFLTNRKIITAIPSTLNNPFNASILNRPVSSPVGPIGLPQRSPTRTP